MAGTPEGWNVCRVPAEIFLCWWCYQDAEQIETFFLTDLAAHTAAMHPGQDVAPAYVEGHRGFVHEVTD